MATIEQFFSNLLIPFIMRSVLTAIILGAICALIGVFIILRKMVFLADGIAHSAFAGGALAILLELNPLMTITVFGLATSVSMAYINEKGKLSNETGIGILMAFAMALAIIFRSMFTTYTNQIDALLFGSITTVAQTEFWLLVIMSIVVVAVLFVIKKELFFITFDEELAKANGLPVRVLSYVFLILVSAVIIISIQSIGVILLLALIVTPAAAAYQLTYDINKMILYAILISVIGSFIGYTVAYILEVAANATIVVVLTVFFLFALAISPKRRLKMPTIEEPYCEICERIMGSSVECPFCVEEEIMHAGAVGGLHVHHEGHVHYGGDKEDGEHEEHKHEHRMHK